MTDLEDFGVVRRTRASDELIDRVKEMILSGRLKPGDRLPTEHELATQMRVSRPTIRESLCALTSMNILSAVQGEGTYVSSLEPSLLVEPISFVMSVDETAIEQLFELRIFLEAGCARLAAERSNVQHHEHLEQILAQYRDNLDDLDACVVLDTEFHNCIAVSTGNAMIAKLLESFAAVSHASRKRSGQSLHVRQGAHDDHRRIVDAITSGDPNAAEEAMMSHLLRIGTELRTGLIDTSPSVGLDGHGGHDDK